MVSFRTLWTKQNWLIILSKFLHYLILEQNKEFWEDYYSLLNKFCKVIIFFKFQSVFVHFAQNKTHESFLSKFLHYLILGQNKEFWEDYYSLWNKFSKVTIFFKFWPVFVHFAQNQTYVSLRSFGFICTYFEVSFAS